MTTDEIGLLDGPEMDALRELRADVPGPTQAQRRVAWERVQGARSQAEPRRKKGGRAWLLAGAAAVAAAVAAEMAEMAEAVLVELQDSVPQLDDERRQRQQGQAAPQMTHSRADSRFPLHALALSDIGQATLGDGGRWVNRYP